MSCNDCGCKEELSVLNIKYNGQQLSCISIVAGDNLQSILKNINDNICTLKENLANSSTIENVGSGKGLYKGVTTESVNEFKTLLEGSGILISELENELVVQAVYQPTALNFNGNTNELTATFVDGTQKTAVIAFNETVTSISQDSQNKTLTYIDELGDPTTLDLSNTFGETLTTIEDRAGDIVYTDENSNETTITLPKKLSDLDDDSNYLSSGDNISELVNDAGYLTTANEVDPIFTAHPSFTITTANINYWNSLTSNATHTGDVVGDTVLTIAQNAVSNTKLSDMPIGTIKGTDTGGDPKDLNSTQVRQILNLDFGTPIANGQVLIGNTDNTYTWQTIAGSTYDLTPTNGSTNAVESNGIYDALELKANLNAYNDFTAVGSNYFNQSIGIYENQIENNGASILFYSGTPSTSISLAGFVSHINNEIILRNAVSAENLGIKDSGEMFFTGFNNATTEMVVADSSGNFSTQTIPNGGNGVTNLSYASSSNTGTVQSSTGTDAIIPAGSTSIASLITPANTIKLNGLVSNATHTGDVTGATQLTISNQAVTNGKIALNTISTDRLLDSVITEPKLAASNLPTTGYSLTYNGNGGFLWANTGGGSSLTTEEVQDIVGGMVSGNSETGISVTYDDPSGKLNFNVSGGGGGLTETSGTTSVGIVSTGGIFTSPATNGTLNWVRQGSIVNFTVEFSRGSMPSTTQQNTVEQHQFNISSLPFTPSFSSAISSYVGIGFGSGQPHLSSEGTISGNQIIITVRRPLNINNSFSSSSGTVRASGSYITS